MRQNARRSIAPFRNKFVVQFLAVGVVSVLVCCRYASLCLQANKPSQNGQLLGITPGNLGGGRADVVLESKPARIVEHSAVAPPKNAGTRERKKEAPQKKERPDSSNEKKRRDDSNQVKATTGKRTSTPREARQDAKSKHDKAIDLHTKEGHKLSRKRHIHVVDAKDRSLKDKTVKPQKKKRHPRYYYLYGKHKFLNGPHDPRKKLIQNLRTEANKAIHANVTTWALPLPLQYPTRNHDSVILERQNNGRPIMVTLLGRYSRYIQSMDLITGKQWAKRTRGSDPNGNPLDNLNHVTAVLVDSLDSNNGEQEIWLPCGFHNDTVNGEESASHVRIVDVTTMKTRVGPKLPVAGGACISKALTILPNEPPMICSFAGTQGNHDKGAFLPYTHCYDRIRQKWWSPFGKLPYGLDHGSLTLIPAGLCHEKDPARVLIFNFRTRPYGNPHPEFLAHDIPKNGWTLDMLKKNDKKVPEKWYVYHNVTDTSHLKDVPRDASGVVMANNGRFILNFGGTFRTRAHTRGNGKRTKKGRTSMIRAFDVCREEWSVVGDLGLSTFALQTAASDTLGVTVTCGGEAPLANSNSPFCFVSRWHNMTVSNPQSDGIIVATK